nr:ATP-binding protein [Hydrocoleum sp. CS-953]
MVGHYDLLLQVFANLVGNAMKFTEAGGRIVIRAYLLESELENTNIEAKQIEEGGWIVSPPPPRPIELHLQSENHSDRFVRIEISDTGSGIEPEDQEAIFERFFRVENRVHTLEGTGLGLSIVRNIIDKHHSKVNLVSELGVGTTFWFDLAVFEEKLVPEENQLLEVI